MKKVFSLLMALMLVMSLAVPASATATIHRDGVTVSPGSSYHDTDLFGVDFKNIMPGDSVDQIIRINGNFSRFSEDSLRITIKGIPHDANNPLRYSENQEQIEGKDDTAVDNNGRDETIATMEAFLAQLDMKITNLKTGRVLLEGKASKLMNSETVCIRNGQNIPLLVEVDVPITMGNEFARRVGEIDWLITVEAFDDPSTDNPKTGDYIMMAVAVMAVSAAALIVILAVKRKKKK